MCSKQIDRDWVIDTLVDDEPSHVAIIIDGNNAIRGIAFLIFLDVEIIKSYYIHLICRYLLERKTRANENEKEKILCWILWSLQKVKIKTVKLSALNHVVGYYYKLGSIPNKRARYSDDDILKAARGAARLV